MAKRRRRRKSKRKPAPPDPPKGYRWRKKHGHHGELERIPKNPPR